jgi:hypothetical protein
MGICQHLCAVAAVQVEGQPVQRPTVTAYLNSAYQCTYGEPFTETPPLQLDEPTAQKSKKRKLESDQQLGEPEQQAAQQQQAPAQAAAGVSTFAAMTQLLLFADAVGSTAPLLRACAAGIDKLCLHVQLPTGPPLDLSIRSPYYFFSTNDSSDFTLSMVTEQQHGLAIATISSAAKTVLVQQVQAQTEVLLWTAYKLQLADAAEAVQGFIRMQTCFTTSVLLGAMRPVLSTARGGTSPRVLDAAAGYSSLQETCILNHLVTQPCAFTRGRVPAALAPTDLPEMQRQPLKFSAEVVRDLLGSTTEEQGRVPVELDILDQALKFGQHSYEAYVVLGPMACTEKAKQAMLGAPTPTADSSLL